MELVVQADQPVKFEDGYFDRIKSMALDTGAAPSGGPDDKKGADPKNPSVDSEQDRVAIYVFLFWDIVKPKIPNLAAHAPASRTSSTWSASRIPSWDMTTKLKSLRKDIQSNYKADSADQPQPHLMSTILAIIRLHHHQNKCLSCFTEVT